MSWQGVTARISEMLRNRKAVRGPRGQVGPTAKPQLDYLNVGCGARFDPGWHNLDGFPRDPCVQAHDVRRPLPYPSDRFELVYHSHVLEHLSRGDGRRFIRECFRVLRPGGVIRVVVPDLEGIARAYLHELAAASAGDEQAQARHEWMVIELLDQMTREAPGGEMLRHWSKEPMPAEEFVYARMGNEVRYARAGLLGGSVREAAPELSFRGSFELHRWMYDRVSLGRLLGECGFEDVLVCRADQSRVADLGRFQLDVDEHGGVRKPDSLFMEGTKPSGRST